MKKKNEKKQDNKKYKYKNYLTVFDFNPTDEEWQEVFLGVSKEKIFSGYEKDQWTQDNLYYHIAELLLHRNQIDDAIALFKKTGDMDMVTILECEKRGYLP